MKLLTLKELAENIYPRYSVRTLSELARVGIIPRVQKIGRRWMYDRQAVQNALLKYQEATHTRDQWEGLF